MNAILISVSLLLALLLFTVAGPSIVVLQDRNKHLENECLKRGYAEWRVNEDDPKIQQFTFK